MATKEGARKTGEAIVRSILPDVCWTPLGPIMVPVPYNISAKLDASFRTTKRAKFTGAEVFTMDSRQTRVTGDEAGAGGGIFSGVHEGHCRPVSGSSTVRAGNQHVLCHASQYWMNCNGPEGPANTIGKLVYIKVDNVELEFPITDEDAACVARTLASKLGVDRGWWDEVTPSFEKKVREIAGKLEIDPNWLMATMMLETRQTLDPTINEVGSATGLIQFVDKNAKELVGKGSEELGKMSAVEQLDYVHKWLEPKKSKLTSATEVYLTVFAPAKVGTKDDTIYTGNLARENPAHDHNKDGVITRNEVAQSIGHYLEEQQRKEEKLKKKSNGIRITK